MTSKTHSLLFFLVLAISMPALAAKAPKSAKAAKAPKAAKVEKKTEPASSKSEILLSHSFRTEAAAELQKLVDRFNETNPAVPVKLVRQEAGGKPVMLNILRRTQVADFVADKSTFKPLYGVMKDAKEKLEVSLSPDLKAGVSDEKGRLVALPLAYATPVLFYNKNAFRKAKLDPEKPPTNWEQMQETVIKLGEAGFKCPYTTSWLTWIHIDNISALSGSPVVNAKGELSFNTLMQVKHIAKLATWKKANVMQMYGQRNEADEKFRDGTCAMLTTDSWAHTEFRDAQGVELGVAPLPHHEDGYIKRQFTLADGPSLWIASGYKAPEYKVAAKFIAFLLTPAVQVELASIYGHLPLTEAARAALKSKALRDRSQTLEVAYASMNGKGASNPLRISAMDAVRIITDEELEKAIDSKLAPKEALDNAVTRGNAMLKAKPALKKLLPM
ncbi:MAG: carbohydrate transporter substrate-binding protein family [Proteobacteria bacterium]|nr:carbohydrate transporter substrate-binding protein family [Pseudomonadota bacterium]